MKYLVNTVFTGSILLLVFAWLAMAHFNDREAVVQKNSGINIEYRADGIVFNHATTHD